MEKYGRIMRKWQVNEFSRLAGVSVRTLHHYDSINLLKASERQPNGFRLYNEEDYQVLLKILSLKFLGFELSIIKNLLDEQVCATTSINAQKKLLASKTEKLSRSYKILENIEAVVRKISLEQLLKIIGAYRILHQLEVEAAKKNISNGFSLKVSKKRQDLTDVLQQAPCHSSATFLNLANEILHEISSLASHGATSPFF